jgi:hypothetical protein
MIGKALVFFLIDQKSLSLTPFLDTLHVVIGIIPLDEDAMNGEKIFAMADILGVEACKKTLAKRKVVNGIKQVGLANAIVTDKAINFIGKVEFRLGIIFKAGQ